MMDKFMKKKLPDRRLWSVKWKKTFLVMKLSIVLTLWMTFSVSASVYSQDARVTLEVESSTLAEVLALIKDQTGVRLLYNVDGLRGVICKNIDLKSVSVEEALQRVLRGTVFVYTKIEGVYVIKENQKTGKQTITIRGWVQDERKLPLPGVTVLVKGVNLGTATDKEGKYELVFPKIESPVITFSFIGMKTVEVKYVGKDTINVVMKEDVKAVEEVIVTGYGNVTRGNYTGAATTIKAEDIMMAGVSSIDQMLQGVVPGMLVMNKTGLVGASPKIRIRGTSTLLGSQEPVWVVDGVIQQDPQPFNSEDNTKFSMDADDIKQLAGNAISWLNPHDIESITVLKDASATAIYGSKAANGVIVITTKKAKSGQLAVNYSGDFSIGQRPRYGLYDQMNSQELMTLSKDIYDERVSYPDDAILMGYSELVRQMINKEITLDEMNREYKRMSELNTDWFKLLFRNSFNHSHNLSISGGSDKIQNRTSFGFTQENGEAKGNSSTSFTATSNTTVNFSPQLTVNMLLKGSVRNVKGFAYGVDPFNYAYNTSRAIPAYNEDGSYYCNRKLGEMNPDTYVESICNYNILNELENTGSNNNTRTWGSTFDVKWRLLPGLEYQGMFSYTSSSSDSKEYATEHSFYITQFRGYEYGSVTADSKEAASTPLPNGGVLETDLTNTSTIVVRNSLVYDRLFAKKHRLTLQLGIETNSIKTKGETLCQYGYLRERGETFATPPMTYSNGTWNIDNAYARGNVSVVNRTDNKLSEYATAVYIYDDRYVLNFSGRYDASNRFGQDKNKRFEPTWSVGGKWRVSNEHFAQNTWWLNNLDLYASYGYQGNAVTSVSPYLIARDGGVDDDFRAYVLHIQSLPYSDLGWEKTKTYNWGVDAAFLNGRLNFTFNYFNKISDVLSSRDIPYENGMANAVVSGSTIKNHGYDFVVNVIPVRTKDFTWQLSVNTSVTRNEVTKNNRLNTLGEYLNGSAVVDGRPYSTFYSYEFGGLNPDDGSPEFKKMDLEGAKDVIEFLKESGKFTPDFSGGLSMMFKYRAFTLYALFAVQWGGHDRLPKLYPNAVTYAWAGLPTPETNVSRKWANRWRKSGDEKHTNIPSLPGRGKTSVTLPYVNEKYQGREYTYVMYDQSDLRVANTDFIRCRSLSLAYEFGDELLKSLFVKRVQLKLSMTNPFMWVSDKKWDGLDPETGNWPARRVTSLSLQVAF